MAVEHKDFALNEELVQPTTTPPQAPSAESAELVDFGIPPEGSSEENLAALRRGIE